MNITDVDDKTIKGANKENTSLKEYTKKYTEYFFEDIRTLSIDKADIYPKATEHIEEMVAIIKKLFKNKIAYKSDDSSIYYDISKFEDYGKLSRVPLKNLKEGARVLQDQYEKGEAKDFALWKAYDKEDGEVFWEPTIKLKLKGRPGWHIECSAMSMKYLGKHFDIHAGGIDLVFPHHENEIAQSEASTGKKFVNYWFHNEHLLVDGKKMSKSLGNFYTLRDLLKKSHNPRAIRYLLLSSHYRHQLNFTFEALKAAQNTIEGFDEFVVKLKSIKSNKENNKIKSKIKKLEDDFEEAMDDDLNISVALSYIFDFMKEINIFMDKNKIGKKNSNDILNLMRDFDSVLGVLKFEEDRLEPELKKLIEEREKARKVKDFEKADKIRARLREKGILLEDTEEGSIWKKVSL